MKAESSDRTLHVEEITDSAEKQQIARGILESLTAWFAVEASREQYIAESAGQRMLAVKEEGNAAGFLCLKETGKDTAEVAVMGVLPAKHRHGIGRMLLLDARRAAAEAGYSFLQVKTVQMGKYEDYDRTNRFYQSLGFQELEVIPIIWGDENPCQIYVLSLNEKSGEWRVESEDGRRSLQEVILRRRSYRGKYKPDKVPREDLTAILEAGLVAPSGCNKQTTSLIAVDDEALLSRLKAEIDPPVAQTAPAMICVLTRRINAYRDRCFATQDYAAAIENMLLAITAMGYQSCWYEGHITDADRIGDRIAKILGVPDEYELVCILPVGIAEDTPTMPKKLPFDERAWFNGFRVSDREGKDR